MRKKVLYRKGIRKSRALQRNGSIRKLWRCTQLQAMEEGSTQTLRTRFPKLRQRNSRRHEDCQHMDMYEPGYLAIFLYRTVDERK